MKSIELPWRHPVVVTLQNGVQRQFSAPFDALDFLEYEWPRRRGPHYENALNLCRAALLRTVPAEVAREAFMASCLEANLSWSAATRSSPRAQAA